MALITKTCTRCNGTGKEIAPKDQCACCDGKMMSGDVEFCNSCQLDLEHNPESEVYNKYKA